MKYVFWGTPEFAAIVLEKLISVGMPPAAVVCNPDRPVGRKKIITPPPTKVLAEKYGIQILQPEKFNEDFKKEVYDLKPDFAVVAAYGKIIPKSVIELFPKGVIGVHPSLLPKYRGASPIQSAILGGETETGVTLYMLDEKMDNGPVLEARSKKLEARVTYLQLQTELAKLGGELLVEMFPKFVEGNIAPQAQDERGATFTKKFVTQDGFVDEKDLNAALASDAQKAIEIDRKIRAFNPEPGSWTYANSLSEWAHANKPFDAAPFNQIQGRQGKRVKLLEAKIENGRLVLTKTQEEGGKPKTLV
ncbi:MAG: methionyl-tRNA formyltransferase [bacterium]|nr:methionyl-tRNA formyltransferase [bacterium]